MYTQTTKINFLETLGSFAEPVGPIEHTQGYLEYQHPQPQRVREIAEYILTPPRVSVPPAKPSNTLMYVAGALAVFSNLIMLTVAVFLN